VAAIVTVEVAAIIVVEVTVNAIGKLKVNRRRRVAAIDVVG